MRLFQYSIQYTVCNLIFGDFFVLFQELTSLQHENVVSLLECKVYQPLLLMILLLYGIALQQKVVTGEVIFSTEQPTAFECAILCGCDLQ